MSSVLPNEAKLEMCISRVCCPQSSHSRLLHNRELEHNLAISRKSAEKKRSGEGFFHENC